MSRSQLPARTRGMLTREATYPPHVAWIAQYANAEAMLHYVSSSSAIGRLKVYEVDTSVGAHLVKAAA